MIVVSSFHGSSFENTSGFWLLTTSIILVRLETVVNLDTIFNLYLILSDKKILFLIYNHDFR